MNENVYDKLLTRIVMGDAPPGTALSEPDLCAELNVSRTPVREALLRLRLEGLVTIIARGGIFVAQASIRRIREITEVRLVLEECSGRLAVARCSPTLLDEFTEWLAIQHDEWPTLSGRERMQRDFAFHAFMDRAADNEPLGQQLTVLRHQSALFWGQSVADQYALEPIIDEYSAVVSALAEKDATTCVHWLQRHTLQHIERIQHYLQPQPMELMTAIP